MKANMIVYYFFNDIWRDKETKFWQWFVSKLPKKLIYFATIHLGAVVTTGKYGKTVVPELTMMDALKRYGDDNKI